MTKILLLTGDAGEAQEIYYAKYRLEEEGWTVHVVTTTKRTFHSVVHDFEPGFDTYTETPGARVTGRRRWRVRAVDRLVHLAAVHGHLLRRFDPQPDLVPADLDHRDRDVVVDDDALVLLAGENQHRRSPLSSCSSRGGRSWSGQGVQARTEVALEQVGLRTGPSLSQHSTVPAPRRGSSGGGNFHSSDNLRTLASW